MTKKVELIVFNNETKKNEKFTREGLNVAETFKVREWYVESVDEENEMIKSFGDNIGLKEQMQIENAALNKQIDWLAELFNTDREFLLNNMEPDVIDSEFQRIMSILDPKVLGAKNDEGKQ